MPNCGECRHDCPRGDPEGHWAHMQCKDTRIHPGHTWSGDHTIYGPYFCSGKP